MTPPSLLSHTGPHLPVRVCLPTIPQKSAQVGGATTEVLLSGSQGLLRARTVTAGVGVRWGGVLNVNLTESKITQEILVALSTPLENYFGYNNWCGKSHPFLVCGPAPRQGSLDCLK